MAQREFLLLIDLPNIFKRLAERYENPPETGEILDAVIAQAKEYGPLYRVLVFVSSNLPPGIFMEHLREARKRTPLVAPGPGAGDETEKIIALPGVALKTGESESDPTDKALNAFADALLNAHRIAGYIIATGDGDFTDLINAVEHRKKEVVVFRPDLNSTHPNLRKRAVPIQFPEHLDPQTIALARTMLQRMVSALPAPEGFSNQDRYAFLIATFENLQIITRHKGLTFRELSQHLWGYLKKEWGPRGITLERCEQMLDALLSFTDIIYREERINASGERVNVVYSYDHRSRLAALLRNPELIA